MIRVVCAIIKDAYGNVLLTQRSGKMEHAFHWEFPGGKVDAGESDFEAIVREIREELDLNVEPVEKLTPVEWEYPGKKIVLVPIICEISSGTLRLSEHLDYDWIALECLEKRNILGADRQIVINLKRP